MSEADRRYDRSPKGIARSRRYNRTEHRREYMREHMRKWRAEHPEYDHWRHIDEQNTYMLPIP